MDYISLIVEFLGFVTGMIYLYYSYNEKIELWYWGFASSTLAILTYYRAQLYSESVLNFYYLIISIYGWYIWKFGVKKKHKSKVLNITNITYLQIFYVILAFIFIYLIVYFGIIYLPEMLGKEPASLPYWDCFCTTGSIVATWMLSRKIIENWILWIIVDGVGIGVNFYKELYFYAILFFFYTIVSILGYHHWKKLQKIEQ